MDIFLASDHAGFELKAKLYKYLKDQGHNVIDYGPHELDDADDYPDLIAPLAHEISQNPASRAIILGGSGQGEAMVANRFPNVRAVVYNGETRPRDGRQVPSELILSREHNDANVLSLGARFLNEEETKEAVELWLHAKFSGEERHVRRLKKIEELSPCSSKADNDVTYTI